VTRPAAIPADVPQLPAPALLIQGRIRCHVTSAIALFTLVAALSLSACISTSAGASQPAGGGGPVAPTAVSTDYPSRCQARDGNQMPDPVCTPGATNPAVTQATISTTICTSGWTATIRPSTTITNKIKKEAIAAYGDYAGATPGSYDPRRRAARDRDQLDRPRPPPRRHRHPGLLTGARRR